MKLEEKIISRKLKSEEVPTYELFFLSGTKRIKVLEFEQGSYRAAWEDFSFDYDLDVKYRMFTKDEILIIELSTKYIRYTPSGGKPRLWDVSFWVYMSYDQGLSWNKIKNHNIENELWDSSN